MHDPHSHDGHGHDHDHDHGDHHHHHDHSQEGGTHLEHKAHAPASVACFVVTSSDTRDERSDGSGRLICELVAAAGHTVAGRAVVRDEPAQLLQAVQEEAPASGARAVIVSGGTGLGRRDTTVETLLPLFEKRLDGFGELFRALSFAEIGTAAMMSRAVAGTLRGMVVFALPGSPAAARLALDRLILPELGHMVREMTRSISAARAARLRPVLEALLDPVAMAARVPTDPVRFLRRQTRPEDAELVGLVSSCLAYGRAELFGAVLEELFRRLGDSPAGSARSLTPRQARVTFAGLSYRFNVPGDLAVLVHAAGRVQAGEGGLGEAFARDLAAQRDLRPALVAFTRRLHAAADPAVAAALGGTRAFAHLVPDPLGGGACKRLMLYLRWMVRGPDAIDLGLWRSVPRSALMVPLDTHVARISRCLGLTRRSDLGWRTAEEVTASLRRFDPEDPVKYDFALCHHGMSGACPGRGAPRACSACRFVGLRR